LHAVTIEDDAARRDDGLDTQLIEDRTLRQLIAAE